MAAGDVLGVTPCDCSGGQVKWTEGKAGGASGVCDSCKEQRFKRSPRAVEGLKATLGKTTTDKKPAAAGEAFDLTKL